MRCASHIQREAVRGCRLCGSLICRECASHFDNKCIPCEKAELKQIRNQAEKSIELAIPGVIFAVVILVLAFYEAGIFNFWAQIFGSIIFTILSAGFCYGWQRLESLSQESALLMGLFVPVLGWMIYFAIKVTIAFWTGWIFALLQWEKAYHALKYVKQQEAILSSMEV